MSISEIFHADPLAHRLGRAPAQPVPPLLPDITPGQLWLVEAPTAKGAPSASVRHALDGANVVIYDRALAGRLATWLPLGAYAEPADEREDAGDVAAARCIRFARDGWSVARLMPPRLPQRQRVQRVRAFCAALAVAKVPGGVPVRVLAEAAYGIREETRVRLDHLADTVATYDRETRLAIVIEAFAGAATTGLQVVAGNGLAG